MESKCKCKSHLHEAAECACKHVAKHDVLTGFRAEGDTPGEQLWMLAEHYLLARSKTSLEDVHPFIEEKADLLINMRHTTLPVKAYRKVVTSAWSLEPLAELMCAPAKDGLIQGCMDWHIAIYWINGWLRLFGPEANRHVRLCIGR